MQHINDLTRQEVKTILAERGEPAYRAGQICEWLYRKRAPSFEAMTNLPLSLRQGLARDFTITRLKEKQVVESRAGSAAKYLLELDDGNEIESVILKHPRGATLCISSQVGCGFGCRFCATATMGLKRNLTPGEITSQVGFLEDRLAEAAGHRPQTSSAEPARHFSNVVFMGMGEPLANYGNLTKAIHLLIEEMGIGSRRITVSTCGVPDKIMKLADEPYEVGLAISLNSPFASTRQELMPAAGRTPLPELMSAARYYYAKKGRMLTFEYVLIDGINDRIRDAHALAGLVREVPAKINLIALNPFPGCPYRPPDREAIRRFQSTLEERGKKVTLRKSLGSDILAGCGQLGSRRARRKTRGRH
jgi:23S rRNA (adenine2503-C2)-methyltransferase